MARTLFNRIAVAAVSACAVLAMLAVPFDAEAQRRGMGGGSSVGRQSPNVMQQRQATTPPAAAGATRQGTPPAAAAAPARAGAAGTAAAGAQRSGMSRFLGPLAGIAAGLGIAALLSSMGLGGAMAEFLSSMLLIAAVVFIGLFIYRRLRAGSQGPRTAMQGAAAGSAPGGNPMQDTMLRRQSAEPVAPVAAAPAAAAAAASALPAAGDSSNWYIPGNFDTVGFLANAKKHFITLQGAWDRTDLAAMRELMTDELMEALQQQLAQRPEGTTTDVVLLNAEMLGIETVSDGHLASVRFSGMLRETPEPEAFRFEEVWNFFKPENGGWLLAGIQQIPVELAS